MYVLYEHMYINIYFCDHTIVKYIYTIVCSPISWQICHTHSTSSTFTRQLNKWNHGLKSQITYKTRKFCKHTFLKPLSLSLYCLRKLISNILHNCMCTEWLWGRGREGGVLAGRGIRAGTRARGSRSLRGKVCKSCDLCRLGAWICHTSVNAVWVVCGFSVGTRKTCGNCAIKWRPHLTHHHPAPPCTYSNKQLASSHIRFLVAVAVYWIVTAHRWLHTPHTQITPACACLLPPVWPVAAVYLSSPPSPSRSSCCGTLGF